MRWVSKGAARVFVTDVFRHGGGLFVGQRSCLTGPPSSRCAQAHRRNDGGLAKRASSICLMVPNLIGKAYACAKAHGKVLYPNLVYHLSSASYGRLLYSYRRVYLCRSGSATCSQKASNVRLFIRGSKY